MLKQLLLFVTVISVSYGSTGIPSLPDGQTVIPQQTQITSETYYGLPVIRDGRPCSSIPRQPVEQMTGQKPSSVNCLRVPIPSSSLPSGQKTIPLNRIFPTPVDVFAYQPTFELSAVGAPIEMHLGYGIIPAGSGIYTPFDPRKKVKISIRGNQIILTEILDKLQRGAGSRQVVETASKLCRTTKREKFLALLEKQKLPLGMSLHMTADLYCDSAQKAGKVYNRELVKYFVEKNNLVALCGELEEQSLRSQH